ncbi:MAG: MotA/TolQ/ExbB proton channel family protein [Acidobacteria bacterium]|nr:MotA/TolQ/ExbB proton channel family protein [Acidobacteriota bacterium]
MHGMTFADLMDPTRIGPVALGVVITLLAMSIASLGIGIERWWTYRLAARQSRSFALEAGRLLKQGKLREVVATAAGDPFRGSPVARLLAAGVQEWLDLEASGALADDPEGASLATREALQQTAALTLADLRRGLSSLATIGSTAPFVGLFGTTFGIIDAFAAMAVTGSGGITVVSAGISEALITTAFGLFVAIPAVWAYNAFLGRVERFGVELDRSGYQLVRHLARRA